MRGKYWEGWKHYAAKPHLFLFLVAAIHLVFFIFALCGAGIYAPDSMEYVYCGINLKEHGLIYSGPYTLPLKAELYTLRPPMYGLIIWFCRLFSGSIFLVLALQNIGTILLWKYLAKLMQSFGFQAYIVHSILIIGLIFCPVQLILTNQVMSDVWLEIFFFAAFYQIVVYFRQPKTLRLLAANIFLALGLLTKPALLYFWVPMALLSLYFFYRLRDVKILLYVLILPATGLLWCWRNAGHTGYFQYSAISNQAMIEANITTIFIATHGWKHGMFVYDTMWAAADKYADFTEKSIFIKKTGDKIIGEHKLLFLALYVRSALNLLLNPGRVDMNIFWNYVPEKEVGLVSGLTEKGWQGALEYFAQLNIGLYILLSILLIFNCLLLVSTAYFVFKDVAPLPLRLFVLFTCLYICAAAGLMGYARYKLMVYPLMLLSIPFFLQVFSKKRQATPPAQAHEYSLN